MPGTCWDLNSMSDPWNWSYRSCEPTCGCREQDLSPGLSPLRFYFLLKEEASPNHSLPASISWLVACLRTSELIEHYRLSPVWEGLQEQEIETEPWCWHMALIPAVKRQRQPENFELHVSLVYRERTLSRNKKKNWNKELRSWRTCIEGRRLS